MGRLGGLGIATNASRNAVPLHLTATVLPTVFASLIGISISAATRWAEYAGSNWTIYAAIRTKATGSARQNQLRVASKIGDPHPRRLWMLAAQTPIH